MGYGWTEPAAYDCGSDVYYSGDEVFAEGQPIATAAEYTEQAENIATGAPDVDPAAAEWMPLGVFALTQDGQADGPSPNVFLQLAISKEGTIAGTMKNTLSGDVRDIEGMADKTSQRAAWTVKGKNRPIMETGIANLTQDTAPALIHFADGQTQQWLLVRLPDPESDSTP